MSEKSLENLKDRLGELEDLVDMDLFPWVWSEDVKVFREQMRVYGRRKQNVYRAYFNKYGHEIRVGFLNKFTSGERPSDNKEKYCKENGVEFSDGCNE